jgi:hypothetical protein
MIRAEQTDDIAAIQEVNRLAFGQEDEALLVQLIRESPGFIPGLSLVAIKDEKVVGHILFSRIHIETPHGDVEVLSLAPMAVLPEFQHWLPACQDRLRKMPRFGPYNRCGHRPPQVLSPIRIRPGKAKELGRPFSGAG